METSNNKPKRKQKKQRKWFSEKRVERIKEILCTPASLISLTESLTKLPFREAADNARLNVVLPALARVLRESHLEQLRMIEQDMARKSELIAVSKDIEKLSERLQGDATGRRLLNSVLSHIEREADIHFDTYRICIEKAVKAAMLIAIAALKDQPESSGRPLKAPFPGAKPYSYYIQAVWKPGMRAKECLGLAEKLFRSEHGPEVPFLDWENGAKSLKRLRKDGKSEANYN